MDSKKIRYVIFVLGAIAAYVSLPEGNTRAIYVKPLFNLSLFWYYYQSTKKLNLFVIGFLLTTLVAETLASLNFEKNYNWILLLFTSAFIFGVIALKPVLKITQFRYKLGDIIVAFIVISGIIYLILSVFVLTTQKWSEVTLLVIATMSFGFFVFSNFFVAAFNRHPKQIYLFVTGAGYLVVCLGGLLYQIMYNTPFVLGTVNTAEVISQYCFVHFLIHQGDVIQKRNWLL